jgi:hypothetical protein
LLGRVKRRLMTSRRRSHRQMNADDAPERDLAQIGVKSA